MASDENVNRDSCVHDPNFAIVCSFFEKFSSLCGIKHPPFSDLQQMLDSKDEISPELIDLHVRLMRKAKKNVNPDRWERTLAKFCYFYHPQDSWELEEYGYKKLNFTQRLKILLYICEAQFDYNVKFKTDVNKLPIAELRLTPIGVDKDGIKYWIHLDEKLDLKLYKENCENETFELVVTDRAGLVDLIETLRSGRDPDRKYEEPSEEEDDADSEVGEEEEEEAEGESRNVAEKEKLYENNSSVKSEPNGEKSTTEEALKTQTLSESQTEPVSSNAPVINTSPSAVNEAQSVSAHSSRSDVSLPKKPHVDVKTRRFDKSPEMKLRKDKVVVERAPKQLKPEEFAQHIEKLKSEKILLPLLSSPLPFPEPPKGSIDSLKTKINMKFNMIKPVLTNEVLMSKIEEVKNNKELFKKVVVKKEDKTVSNYVMQMNKGRESTSRAGKPGLKLEQILKSKLAQKLAANEPAPESSAVAVTSPSSTTSISNQAAENLAKTEPPAANTDPKSVGTPKASQSAETPSGEPSAKRKLSQDIELEAKKPKLDDANSQLDENTKNQSQSNDNNAGEIEEPLMLVTGVGSGAECQSVVNPCEDQDDGDEREFVLFVNGPGSGIDCNSPNYFSDDDDEREFCMFITGPGSGVECATGNNESTAEEASDKEKPPATLTHKVENILSSKSEIEGDRSGTSVGSNEETPKKTSSPASDDSAEKKKPKLWTIDAICNSNSSKDTSNKEDISCFPNFSFNKDKKSEVSYRNEFSFFNMPRAEPKENDAIPTNFYFGSDTQMPPYVAPDVRNTNNLKAAKSHNVKDIVQLDGGEDKPAQAQVYSTFTNSHSEQVFNLCTRQNSPSPVATGTESELTKGSGNVYSDVMSLSTSNEVKSNQNEFKNSTDAINRKETLSLVEYPSSSPESSQDIPDDRPQSEANSSTKIVEDKSLSQEPSPVTIDHAEHIPQPEASSKTNKNIEAVDEASAPTQEFKPEEVLSEKSIPTIDEPVSESDTLQKDENFVRDVLDVTHNEPHPELSPSLDSTKELVKSDPRSKDDLIETEIASQSEKLTEKDVVSTPDVDLQKSVELFVETPAESTLPEKSPIEIPSQPVKETLPKSEPTQDNPSELEPIQEILPESQRIPQTSSESPSIQETIELVQIADVTEEPKSKVSETVLEKEELTREAAEQLDLVKHDSKTVQEKLNDKSDEFLAPKCESPESDDDYCAPPSPTSPEPVINKEPSSEPSASPSKDISLAESNDNEKSNKVKPDLAEIWEKSIQEPMVEPVVEKSTSQLEKIQEVPELAIKPTSAEISEPIEDPKPKPRDAVVENQHAPKEISLTPPEEPLKASESKSKPNEQIIEQSTTPVEKEKTKLTKEKTKSVKDTTPVAEKIPKSAEKPEKKSKKAKIAAEEVTTPSPVLRTSSRIGTRSARKDPIAKKEEEEEEDDRKGSKTTSSKAKLAVESKPGKKGKAAAKAAKQAVEEEVEIVESTAEPVVAKKSGRGRKKKVVDTIVAKPTPTKAPSPENSSDENASDNVVKPTLKEAKEDVVSKETKFKTASKSTPKKEKKNNDEADKKAALEANNDDEKKSEKTPKTPASKKKTSKRGWFTEVDVSNLESTSSTTPIRQSRRIAQLKIKEQAEGKYVEEVTPTKKTSKEEAKAKQQTPVKKNNKTVTKKTTKSKAVKEDSDGDDSSYEKSTPSKKKRKKKDMKKKLKSGDTWKARSDSSSEEEPEEDDHFEEDEDDEEIALNDASDHEFSPESDLEDEDFQPVKRARTAHSKPKTEEDKSEQDDLCCQKCRTAEQPEWILLCDKCDEGWHASCLRPPLMSIPEGDWFCPPCQHNLLINSLHKFLKTYDKKVKKRDNEELRKQRLQYVGISTTNIIADFSKTAPTPDESSTSRKKTSAGKNDISDDQSSEEEEESEPDEPLYTLRVRRQANVSYTLKEYDEIMNSAIQREYNEEETEEVPQLVPAAPEQTKPEVEPVTEKPEAKEAVKQEENEDEEKSSEEEEEDEEEEEAEVVPPLFRNVRKKPARLTKLDVSSDDDHYSDEDFKGSSAEDYDDDEYAKSETDSDEARYRKSIREPVRRSTRARVTRYDNDFINDDDSDEDDFEPKKKKKKSRNSDSDSEEEDSTWGKRKRNKYSRAHKPTSSKKKRRRVVFDGDSDEENERRKEKKPKKSRITYGLEVEEDNYPQRRTRGKKINYVENLGSDSEEDNKIISKSRKILSDDDDYVNEEEEDEKSPSKSAKDDAGDQSAGKEKSSESVLENGTKSDVGDCGDGAKTDPTSLHELIATNNTGVIRTYSKTTATVTPPTNIVTETTGAYQNPKLEPVQPISDANDLTAANKLTPLSVPPQMTPMVVPPAEPLQVYSGVIKEEGNQMGNQMAPKRVDSTNPSLEGMQSMAQSIPQMMSSPSNYSMARKMMPMPGDGAQYAPPNPYGDVGIGYEDAAVPEGMPGPPPPRVITDPQHPLRGMPPSGPPEGVRMGPPNPAQLQMGSRPPHLPPGVGPPSYMGPMMPHNPTAAMMHRGSMPPMMPMSPQMAAAMHMRGPRPQHGPGLLPGMPPMNMNQSPPNPIPNQPIEVSEPAPKKRGARGKGKKQLEMERVKREAEAAAAAAAGQEGPNPASEEMIPLHMLKPLPGSDMNPAAATVRPPGAPPAGVAVPTTAYNSSSPPNFANYPPPPGAAVPGSPNQMARLPFSTASSISPGAVTVSVGNSPSKRVKITPTRMRMPGNSPPNVLRFPARPGQPPQMMHSPSPSGGSLVTVNSSPLTSAENTPAATAGTPPNSMVAAEIDTKKRPSSASAQPPPGPEQQAQQKQKQQPPTQPQQYYQPPSYPPMPQSANQMLRGGFNPRPEFAGFPPVAQKPMPPPMYSHPTPMATTGAPTTVISRPATTNASVISGPISTPAAGSSPKPDPATSVNSTTAPAYSAAPPYPSNASPGSISTPTSKPTNAAAASAVISTAAGAVPPSPPTSAYQTLHMKQLPPHAAHSTAPPYNATPPYYAVAPMMPNSYPPPSRPPITSAYGPPPGSMGFSPRQPQFGKSPSPYGAPPPAGPPPSRDQAATNSVPPTEYQAGSQDQSQAGFQYQESIPPATNDAEFQASSGYEEEATPTSAEEQPSGEFGGLVSYFSSQREDDLDA